MSNPHTRLESVRPSIREDLLFVTELVGLEPEPSDDYRVWNQAAAKLQRVTASFIALNDPALSQLGKACLEFTHLLASQQFQNSAEACQRLLACLQILADHSHHVASSAPQTSHWPHSLLQALGAQTGPKAEPEETGTRPNDAHLRQAANEHVTAFQEALLNWLTGRDPEQSLAKLTQLLQKLRPQMAGTVIAELATLTDYWRSNDSPLDGHARQCLSRAERLLQQMANGEDFAEREQDLQAKLEPLLAALPKTPLNNLHIDPQQVDQSGYWRPPQPAPADREAWVGLAAALRDELRYVIESLDIATRVAPSQAPDMSLVAERIFNAANVLAATNLSDWSQQLTELAERTRANPSHGECLTLAEDIQDVLACLEPEVIEQRQQNQGAASRFSTHDAVAELSRTAVVDAALGSIARLSARFEIIAASEQRPNSLKPTEEIDALWGASRVLRWDSLSDATAWLRDCAQRYLTGAAVPEDSSKSGQSADNQLLSTLLTGCVVVERFLQTVRLPWPNIESAEQEMLSALQQLAPSQFRAH